MRLRTGAPVSPARPLGPARLGRPECQCQLDRLALAGARRRLDINSICIIGPAGADLCAPGDH